MRGYLQRAKLGIVIGDTVFVHGGISPDTLGWLPPPLQTEPNAREWIEKLNMFAENQVQNLPSSDADDGDDGDVWDGGYAWSIEGGYTGRGADDLLQYGMRLSPTGWNNPGVVYNGFMKKDWTGAVDLSDDSYREVVDYLNRAGIFRVVCGHTPHGDAGLVVRTSRSDTEGGELTCITLDTSYSAQVLGMDIAPAETSPKQSPLTPKRHGVAVSELLLFREDDVGDEEKGLSHPRYKAVIHGVMVDGQLYEAHPDNSDAEIVAGDQVGQGWYVKGKRVRDGHIILSRNLPRSAERPYGAIENKYVSPVESISSLGQTLGD